MYVTLLTILRFTHVTKMNVIMNRTLNIDDEYIFDLSQNAGRKLSILARLLNQNFERKRTLIIAFVE